MANSNKSTLHLPAISQELKTGNEALSYEGLDFSHKLLHFWQWSASDLISNATRGRLAEFIVGTALNLDMHVLRDEWNAFDLVTPEGITIEVKSAAYIQSWHQSKFSSIAFSIKPAKQWEDALSNRRGIAKRHADIYVFCLLKHTEQATIDPLKMEQREFYVVSKYILETQMATQKTIRLSVLLKHVGKVNYLELKEAVDKAYSAQK